MIAVRATSRRLPLVALPLLCCIAASLSSSHRAVAAPPATPLPQTPEMLAAQGHWQAGKAYFEKGELTRALREFREAARDVDLPALDYNIAKTYDRLGDAARAVDYYKRYLARATVDAEDRREVSDRIAALLRQVGRIFVTSKVSGTSFLVDEEPVPAERLAAGFSITVGKHRLLASKEGYLTGTAEVVVTPTDDQRVEVNPISQQAIIVNNPPPVVTSPPPVVTPPVVPPVQPPPPEKKSRSWIAGMVVAMLATGAGITIALWLALSGTDVEPPYKGNVDPGIITIPLTVK